LALTSSAASPIAGLGPDADEERARLVTRIHRNGLRALHHSIQHHRAQPNAPANTSYFDCVIGSRLSMLALQLVPESAPPAVHDFLVRHHQHEMCHCAMATSKVPAELADRIAAFHERVLRESGWAAYLACMPLTGERMALGTAFALRNDDDPHTTVKGFLDEFHHTSYPLLLLGLFASPDELRRAAEAQEKFLGVLGIAETIYEPTGERVCTAVGREAHECP